MTEIIITAAITAFIVSPISAFLATKIQRHFDNKKGQEEILFDVYMKLMELNGYYFWLKSSELRKESEPKDIVHKSWQLRWEIADGIRKLDFKEMEELLETLFLGRLAYSDRHQKLSDFITKLGNKINPKYDKIMSKITKENLNNLSNKHEN